MRVITLIAVVGAVVAGDWQLVAIGCALILRDGINPPPPSVWGYSWERAKQKDDGKVRSDDVR